MTSAAADLHKEALRQQMLLRALFGDARPGVVAGWLRQRPGRVERGLGAYRANAGVLAEKVLAATFPTLAQLLGSEATAGLARAHWRAAPPLRGDLAQWGEGLPAFIASDAQLASEPYLADVARLDWAVHQAEMAADAPVASGLESLASAEAASLRLQMMPGTALVSSAHPIATIWHAHRPAPAGSSAGEGHDRFAAVRSAFAAGCGESALVVRGAGDWHATVLALAPGAAAFTAAVLAGRCLGDALESVVAGVPASPPGDVLSPAGAPFDFEHWLIDNLQHRRIAAVIQNR